MGLDPEIPGWVPQRLRDRRLWWTLMGCGLAVWRPDALRRLVSLMQGYTQRQSTAILQELEDTLGVLGVNPERVRQIIQALPISSDHLG